MELTTKPLEQLSNLNLISESGYYSPQGDKTTISKFELSHDPSVKLLKGQPDEDIMIVELPEIIAKKFEEIMLKFPGVEEFNPNFGATEENLQKFESIAALVIGNLLQTHSPAVLPFLKDLEHKSKNIVPEKAPHVVFKGLKIGSVKTIPKHDYPEEDREYFEAQSPYLSEMVMMGFNHLLGFARLPVRGEKGGVPVHHHVPLQSHPSTGTSISFKTPVAIHGEDVHNINFYSHFLLFGKLGNKEALTPLMTCRSFMSQIPKEDRAWLMEGMKLNYIFEPGAGRVDDTPERLISPIIDCDLDDTLFIRFSNADYFGIESGIHIYRQRPLPKEWYGSKSDYELASRTLTRLREIFRDVPLKENKSPYVFRCSIETGDLVFVSNKTGQHSRSPFEGPRYVHRMYSQFDPKAFFLSKLTATTMEERLEQLSGMVNENLDQMQQAYLSQQLDLDLVSLHKSYIFPDQTRSDAATALGKLASMAVKLKYTGQNPSYLGRAKSVIERLYPLVRELYSNLIKTNQKGLTNLDNSALIHLTTIANDATESLSRYSLNLNKLNYRERVEVLTQIILDNPGQIDETCRKVKEVISFLVDVEEEKRVEASL